jgi:hypothetical protein
MNPGKWPKAVLLCWVRVKEPWVVMNCVLDNTAVICVPAMLDKLSRIIDHVATVRVLVVLTLLATFFPVLLFPAAGLGNDIPLDLYLSYSPDQVYAYLTGLGPNGRIAYARMELTTDLVFPLVYSSALTVAMVMAGRCVLPDGRFRSLCLFPLLIVIADWSENLCLAMVIHAFPHRFDRIVTVASLFTSLKWTFIILAVMTLLVAGAIVVAKQFGDRQGDS